VGKSVRFGGAAMGKGAKQRKTEEYHGEMENLFHHKER
jgi:hypothetical protein